MELISLLVKLAWLIGEPLFWSAVAFGCLAVVLKGRSAVEGARRAAHETRITLALYVFDLLLIGPPLGIAVAFIGMAIQQHSLAPVPPVAWSFLGIPGTLLVTVFIGDAISYWRHRLEHTRWLWPAHAIHHSDREMTWLTGNRFHPANRVVTAVIDNTVLALLGVPPWALAANELIRHYYGEFLHADVPWTYGRLGRLFVSPAMHRWHHTRDVTGAGSNFATVFSVFDQVFGTFYVPGPCRVPLGVTEDVGDNAFRQLTYPFRRWGRDIRRLRRVRLDRGRRQTGTPSDAHVAAAPLSGTSRV